MDPVRRTEFIGRMVDKTLDVAEASRDPTLSGVDLAAADKNGDGRIGPGGEAGALFSELERAVDSGASSVAVGGERNPLDCMMDAALALARPEPTPPQVRSLSDRALKKVFGHEACVELRLGATGQQVDALQYALARLELYTNVIDGSFGEGTKRALEKFQGSAAARAAGVTPTGILDEQTLLALDAAVAALDRTPPALKAPNPYAYLSDFAARGLSKIEIADTSQSLTWSRPEVQKAYGRFVQAYWKVLKENRVECDCKALALFFLHQFRAKLREDTGIALPMPQNGGRRLADVSPSIVLPSQRRGYPDRIECLQDLRPGYDAVKRVEALDPGQSLLPGPNFIFPGVSAHAVYRCTTPVEGQEVEIDNHGDNTQPEIPIENLQPGDLIFIDHGTRGAKVGHAINVVGVERDAENRVRRIVLAVGTFDDMKDTTSATPPRGVWEINNFVEEVTVDLNDQGRIQDSRVTYSSEATYLRPVRGSGRSTLMELSPGGFIKVCRWG